MKKLIIIIGFIFLGFIPEKKYSVTLPVNQWQKYINILEVTKNTLKQSDIPSKYSFPLIDSLQKMEEEFSGQIIPQLPDSLKAKK